MDRSSWDRLVALQDKLDEAEHTLTRAKFQYDLITNACAVEWTLFLDNIEQVLNPYKYEIVKKPALLIRILAKKSDEVKARVSKLREIGCRVSREDP